MYETYFGESQNFEFCVNQINSLIQGMKKDRLKEYKDSYDRASSDLERRLKNLS